MSFASFTADLNAMETRGEWWAVLTITDPDGSPVSLYYSRRGAGNKASAIIVSGDTIAAHQRFEKRINRVPSVTHSMWKDGALLSNSFPSYTEFTLRNDDRGLDRYAPKNGYIWAGGSFKLYFLDAQDVNGSIGKVCEGRIGKPSFSLSPELSVSIYGLEEQFNRPLHSRVYRGTSYMLELFGDCTTSFGTPAPINLTGNMTIEGWFWLDAAPTIGRRAWGWGTGATFPWSFGITDLREVVISCTISGGLQFKLSTTLLTVQKPYHIAVIINGRDVRFLFWDDDNQILLTENHVNAFTSATRQAFTSGGAGTGYLLKSDGDATFRPWFDELRVWNYGLADQEIADNRHRPLIGSSIPATCVHRLGCDDGTGTTVTDSSATAAHGTITGTGTSTWLWAMEGGPELAGTPKPDVLGRKFGVRPVLVDPIRNIWQCHWGNTQSIQVYEGGESRIMDATAASMRAFAVSSAPVSGHFLPYLSRGYIKGPATAPILPISALVEGAKDGALGYADTASEVSRYLAVQRAVITDPSGIDTASYTTFEAGFNPVVGFAYYNPKDKKVRDGLDDSMRSAMGWWGHLRGSSLLHIQHFAAPGAASRTYDQRHIYNIEDISPEGIVYEVEVRYRYNDVVLTDDQVASSVKGTESWLSFVKPYLYERSTDHTLKGRYEGKGGKVLVVETGIYYASDAKRLADELLPLLKGERQVYRITLSLVALNTDRGESESIAYAYPQTGIIVNGLDGSEDFLVVSVGDSRQEGRMTHDIMR